MNFILTVLALIIAVHLPMLLFTLIIYTVAAIKVTRHKEDSHEHM